MSALHLNAADPAGRNAGDGLGNLRISEPYVHENLTVFLLHGPDAITGRKFLTLQEALDSKGFIVHETGNVNELAVENLLPESDVYIMSGDIVKGGRQDRVLPYDFIVPPKSGKMPIGSFCVEQGRWSARAGEASAKFSRSDNCLTSKNLKLAARARMEQGEVWKRVAENQQKLSDNLGLDVKSKQSASSLQLTLENGRLNEMTEAYLKTVGGLLAGKSDVVGYAFAVNGTINSVEVFGSAELFAKLYPKLIRAAAVEAISERTRDGKFAPAGVAAVRSAMADAARGKESQRDLTKRVREVKQESEKIILFDTRDRDNGDASLRKSYIAK
jgi:hypothetical protein